MAEDEAGEAEVGRCLCRMPWTEFRTENKTYILVFDDQMKSFKFFFIEYIYIHSYLSWISYTSGTLLITKGFDIHHFLDSLRR